MMISASSAGFSTPSLLTQEKRFALLSRVPAFRHHSLVEDPIAARRPSSLRTCSRKQRSCCVTRGGLQDAECDSSSVLAGLKIPSARPTPTQSERREIQGRQTFNESGTVDTWLSRVSPEDRKGSQGLGLKLLLGSVLVGAALSLAIPLRVAAQSKKDGVTGPVSSAAGSAVIQSPNDSSPSASESGLGQNSSSKEPSAKAGEAASANDEALKQAMALEMLEGFLKKHPDDVDALKMLLRVRMKSADFHGGLKVLDSLIRIQPTEREWRFLRAQVLEFSGDLAGARSAFQAILEQEPFSARAMQGLASIMRQSGEDSLVLGMVEDAIERAEDEDKAADVTNLKLLLGQLHAMQGNINEAVAQYDAVLQQHPRDFRPYLCKGLVLSLAGEGEKADKLFKEFRERCPKAYAPYLDNVIVRSSVEARRLLLEEKAVQAQGNKERPGQPMKQPKSAET